MKIIYISAARIPSEKAHPYQILQMCDAFMSIGVQVELLHPRRRSRNILPNHGEIQHYYGLQNEVNIITLPALNTLWIVERYLGALPNLFRFAQRKAYHLMLDTYYIKAKRYLQSHLADKYYCRDIHTFRWFIKNFPQWKTQLFLEIHDWPVVKSVNSLVSQLETVGGVITITERLKDKCVQYGMDPQRVLVAPDGVNLKRFEDLPTKTQARRSLGMPENGIIVAYIGHFYPWKGVETIVRSMDFLPEEYSILLVGGWKDDVTRIKQLAAPAQRKRLSTTGYVPPEEVIIYLAAADVLVLPTSGNKEIGRYYTSPLKLFEYMAAQRPIVASDLPSLREVLKHKHNAYLVEPDDPQALAEGIHWVVSQPEVAQLMATQAQNDVQEFTWEKRAKRVVEFMRHCGFYRD